MSNYYQLYMDDVLKLASSIVIKSTDAVDGLNNLVSTNKLYANLIDPVDPSSWKYYLNVSGQYHVSDQMMQVISLDTLELINFTKENLSIHIATATGYQYGTRNYQQLLSLYPDQELLIRGILYPVDIDTAIDASDGQILSYPSELVEVNEYTFIDKLQAWIFGYKDRWVNKQYNVSDSLYAATNLGIMYLHLIPAIVNIRLAACKTNEAHSFHIRQYLSSRGIRNDIIDLMTIKQRLYFYRNVAYLEKNIGFQSTLDTLVQNVMTVRGLPIAEYLMRHDVSEMPFNNIVPKIIFDRQLLNDTANLTRTRPTTLLALTNKEIPIARDNADYLNEHLPAINNQFLNSQSNTVSTKVLETSVTDYTNSDPYSFEATLINNWLYLSSVGLYDAHIEFSNPTTNETLVLGVKDAFILAWYCYCKSQGIDLTSVQIPKMVANRVPRLSPPNLNPGINYWLSVTADEIYKVTDSKMYRYDFYRLVPYSLAQQLIQNQPRIKRLRSTDAFYKKIRDLHDVMQNQVIITSRQENLYARSMVANMINQIYSDTVVDLNPTHMTYRQWFISQAIPVTTLGDKQDTYIDQLNNDVLYALFRTLVEKATGLDLHRETTLSAIQTAMVGLMTRLTSYSIQILQDINHTPLQDTNGTAIRVSNIRTHTDSSLTYELDVASVQHHSELMLAEIEQDIEVVRTVGFETMSTSISFVPFSIPDVTPTRDLEIRYIPLNMNGMDVNRFDTYPENEEGITPVQGLETFLNLTLEQKKSLRDVYNPNAFWAPPVTSVTVAPDSARRYVDISLVNPNQGH